MVSYRQFRASSMVPVSVVVTLLLTTVSPVMAHANRRKVHLDTNFHDSNIIQDEEHLKDHLKEFTNIRTKEMSPEELEFHYFKLHDLNNDTSLDGLEILAALLHSMPGEDIMPTLNEEEMKSKSREQVKQIRKEREEKMMQHYTDIIDNVFKEDDYNDDGYLNFIEYTHARRREERRYKRSQEKVIHEKQHQTHK